MLSGSLVCPVGDRRYLVEGFGDYGMFGDIPLKDEHKFNNVGKGNASLGYIGLRQTHSYITCVRLNMN